MTEPQSGDSRREAQFGSVDSRPQGLATSISPFRVPAMLLTFCLLALFQLWIFGTGQVDWLFPQRDYIFAPYTGQNSIAIRTYIVSFYIAFACYGSGSVLARLFFGFDLVLRFLLICCLLDLINTIFLSLFGDPYALGVVQIFAGLIGFGLFSLMLLERGSMPDKVDMDIGENQNLRPALRLAATAVIAAALSGFVGYSNFAVIEGLRDITLLGGIGPGVLLFLPLLFLQLYVISVIERRLDAKEDYRSPVSIIVPAYNEQYIIADTIRHIDQAALHYGELVELIVLDNASTDDTATVAQAAIDEATSLQGRIVHVAQSGKAHALNRGIQEARHPITIRIDADTLIGPDNISLAVQNFSDDEIGVVGGIPLPPGGAIFDRARLVEVLVKHGYYSPALSSLWGLVGVPGMFAAYRTGPLKSVGEFAAGMNGEDTDMSLRIGEMGYRAIVDHRIHYVSEVPTSFAHLREQRLRWFRSVYHVSSRCQDIITSSSLTMRGKLILPYMLLNSARRAMMVPILLFGIFHFFTDTDPTSPLVWQAIAAVLIGAPVLVAVAAVLINRRPDALLAIPEYVLFRVMRAWFTLESVLTIPITRTAKSFRKPSLSTQSDASQ
ncbi:glycosyltransferase family 2 protein [uncultured Parasphingorhabdus sp.]|uniref:glycosyltransferase n=1 Tax=uncultured Parasphingorhabdus sp. TaxID=2709694 RepID=UPI0030D7C94E